MNAAAVQTALQLVFAGPGASVLQWERGTRCDCYNAATDQPEWGHAPCGGFGVIYADPIDVRVLFRSQGRWQSFRMEGQIALGEAELTTPRFSGPGGVVACEPSYTDDRVRDRFRVPAADGDAEAGRVFYPASTPIPFLMANTHLAWRVQLQSMEQDDRVTPQP